MARTANALILTGCTLQQPYQAPQMAVATRWHAPMPHQGSTRVLVDWRTRFNDPALAQLIGLAHRHG